jgi:hypothetical protein
MPGSWSREPRKVALGIEAAFQQGGFSVSVVLLCVLRTKLESQTATRHRRGPPEGVYKRLQRPRI